MVLMATYSPYVHIPTFSLPKKRKTKKLPHLTEPAAYFSVASRMLRASSQVRACKPKASERVPWLIQRHPYV